MKSIYCLLALLLTNTLTLSAQEKKSYKVNTVAFEPGLQPIFVDRTNKLASQVLAKFL